MGALVDSAREAGDDDIARLAEPAREAVGESKAGGGRVARADDGDRRLLQSFLAAAQSEQRRRGVDMPQRRRIVGLAIGDEADAELARRLELALDLVDAGDADRPAGAAAPRQLGQGGERRRRAAAAIEERAEGARADVLASGSAAASRNARRR